MNAAFFPDVTDLAILDAIQEDVPLVSHPWEVIGARVGLSEQKLIARLKRLERAGIFRAISPILEPEKWGLSYATLVAVRVPPERVDDVAKIISSCPWVSHNFRREHEYPLWFTLTGKDEGHVRELLVGIIQMIGVPEVDVLDLPTVRRLKVEVRFPFRCGESENGRP